MSCDAAKAPAAPGASTAAKLCRPRPPGLVAGSGASGTGASSGSTGGAGGGGGGGGYARTTSSSSVSSALVSPGGAFGGAIPAGYGFVVLTAIGSVMLVTWKAIKVGQARQEYKIPYPALYSPDNMAFNCIQRAHQNTMENLPQFLALLLIGGLEMPYFCTLGGMIWIMGRIAYAKGYYTGDPRKRSRGAFGILGMLMLLAATTKFAFRHLRG